MDTPQTKESAAYQLLKEHILKGKLPMNAFLSQRKLAELAGSNIVTTRAACKRLEQDGLLEYIAKWGFRIPLDTEETLADRFYLRKVLETAAVLRAIEQGTLEHESVTGPLLETARQCDAIDTDAEGSPSDFAVIHFRLHQMLVDAAGSPLLSSTFSRITLISLFYMNTRAMWNSPEARYQGRHLDLLEAVCSCDRSRAEAVLHRHIDEGMENQLCYLRHYRDKSQG